MANNAEDFAAGLYPGYEVVRRSICTTNAPPARGVYIPFCRSGIATMELSAWEGIKMTIGVINSKMTKIAINRGSLNPRRLAEQAAVLIRERGYCLTVAYISGDDLVENVCDVASKSALVFCPIQSPPMNNSNPSPTPVKWPRLRFTSCLPTLTSGLVE